MFKFIFACLFIFVLVAIFYFPKQSFKTVHNFWQSNPVRSSIVYGESIGVPAAKIITKTANSLSYIVRRLQAKNS